MPAATQPPAAAQVTPENDPPLPRADSRQVLPPSLLSARRPISVNVSATAAQRSPEQLTAKYSPVLTSLRRRARSAARGTELGKAPRGATVSRRHDHRVARARLDPDADAGRQARAGERLDPEPPASAYRLALVYPAQPPVARGDDAARTPGREAAAHRRAGERPAEPVARAGAAGRPADAPVGAGEQEAGRGRTRQARGGGVAIGGARAGEPTGELDGGAANKRLRPGAPAIARGERDAAPRLRRGRRDGRYRRLPSATQRLALGQAAATTVSFAVMESWVTVQLLPPSVLVAKVPPSPNAKHRCGPAQAVAPKAAVPSSRERQVSERTDFAADAPEPPADGAEGFVARETPYPAAAAMTAAARTANTRGRTGAIVARRPGEESAVQYPPPRDPSPMWSRRQE